MHGHAELLAHDVEAGELERGVQLRAVVVQARGGIADREAHLLQREDIVAAQVLLQGRERARGVLATAAHLAQPHVAVGCLHLHDGAHEAPPVRAVAVAGAGASRGTVTGVARMALMVVGMVRAAR